MLEPICLTAPDNTSMREYKNWWCREMGLDIFPRAAVYNHSERFPTAPMPANLPNTAPEVNPDPPG